MLQARKSRVLDPIRRTIFFLIYQILPAALGPGVCSASSRNYYQKQIKIFMESRARPVSRADSLTAIGEPIV
jgi:hypothetical protein